MLFRLPRSGGHRNQAFVKIGRIGVISDTHGLLRPEAIEALQEAQLIIHAGDVGAPEVIEKLQALAPVVAVRGNGDRGKWARSLSPTEAVEINGITLYVLHDISRLDLDPAAAGFRAVVAGHSHRPCVVERRGVLYLNPGSAGPRRFRLPVSVALLDLKGDLLRAELIELQV